MLRLLLILLSMLLPLFPSLGDRINGITPYGQASFVCQPDITWLSYDGELYCRVGSLDGDPVLEEGVAAFHATGNYTCELFPVADHPGLLAVHSVSRIDLEDDYDLYASLSAGMIPCQFIFDFPHEYSWFSDGLDLTIEGRTYESLGTSTADFAVGERLGSCEGRDYYEVPGYEHWLALPNESDPARYDLYYDRDAVTGLPAELLFEANRY